MEPLREFLGSKEHIDWLNRFECGQNEDCLRLYMQQKSAQKVATSFPYKFPQLYLFVQEGRVQLKHSNHIVKVCAEATC